jgi:hypothetical protein
MTFPRHHVNCPRYDPADVLPVGVDNYFVKMQSGAVFSDDRKYRYMLWRTFEPSLPPVNLVGLNPSSAGEVKNDTTITKDIGFAGRWGCGQIIKTNLFALVSTDPAGLAQAVEEGRDPVGRAADLWLAAAADYTLKKGGKIVLCYGDGGEYMKRYARADELLHRITDHELYCLGTTQRGNPKHTSRLAYATELVRVQS